MKERLYYFDSLRCFAIIAVVFIHSNGVGYTNQLFSTQFNFSVIFRQIANFGVPLFLAISGYFMSRRKVKNKKDYLVYLRKVLPRVFIPFIIWSFFYSFTKLLFGADLISLVKQFVFFQASVPFYFILLIIQYYILQPFIIKLGKTKRGVIVALVISLLMCVLIEYIRFFLKFDIPPVVYAGNFLTWLVFPVLGAYLYFKSNVSIKPVYLFCISTLMLLLSCFHSFFLINLYENFTDSVTAVKTTSFLYSFFLIVLLFSIKYRLTLNKYIVDLGALSFGVYFAHIIFLQLIQRVLVKVTIFYNQLFFQILTTLLVLLISYFLGKMLKGLNDRISTKYLGY